MKIKILSALLAGFVICSAESQAALVVYNFNDNDLVVDLNELAADGLVANNVSITTSGAVTAGVSSQRLQRNLLGGATATYGFTFDIGATPMDFTELSFVDGIDSNAGGNMSYSRWTLTTSIGSASPTVATRSALGTTEVSGGNTFALSGMTNLSNTSVTFTFVADYATDLTYSSGTHGSRLAYIDDVTFTASTIPEPSIVTLFGTMGTTLLLRRRL